MPASRPAPMNSRADASIGRRAFAAGAAAAAGARATDDGAAGEALSAIAAVARPADPAAASPPGSRASVVVAGFGRVRQLHRRRRDVDDVELLRQRLDDHADVVEVAGEEPLAQRRARDVEPPRAQVGHGRHRRDLDLLLGEALDAAQQPVLARLGERDRRAAAARRGRCGRCGARRPPATAGTS